MATLLLQMNQNLFLRDPQDTSLGRNIVKKSIIMIDEIGFEAFTFKKLAVEIESTEASIYRYFENKHKLLVYLIAWYWNWLEYKIDYDIHNIPDSYDKLERALYQIAIKKDTDPLFPEIDESALYRVVLSESDKTYLTKQVDEDNKEGLFRGYKSLCNKIASIILEINPDFKYPHSLISTILQASHHQIFYAQHLPSLSDLDRNSNDLYEDNFKFLKTTVFNTIQSSEH